MTIKYMNCVIDRDSPYSQDSSKYEYTESKATPGNGNTIIIPIECKNVLCGLHIVTGNGKIQHTISTLAEVKAGTETWIDWTSGAVSSTTEDEIGSVTAIRLVNVSGTVKLVVIAY